MDLGAQERAGRLVAAMRRLRELADEVDRIAQGINSDTNTRLREFRRFADQGASDLRTAARIVGGEAVFRQGREWSGRACHGELAQGSDRSGKA